MIAIRKPGAFSRRINRLRRKKRPQFSDHYALGEEICKGSQGVVYRAYDLADATKNLAVKIVERKDLNEEQEKQILREVTIMRNLADIENINKIVDFFASSKKYFIVQELALGGDVFDWVVNNGCYHEHEAREFAIKLLTTIQEFHSRGYIHRDLKPENLLLANKSNTSVRVADWGYGDRFDPQNLPTQKCGTPAFTPPELLDGKPYNQAVDCWSAGCVLYMIMAGRPAFHANDNKELFRKISAGEFRFHTKQWGGISNEAKELIQGLLTVDPEARLTAQQAVNSDWLKGRSQRLATPQ